jgi:hypothetical protein
VGNASGKRTRGVPPIHCHVNPCKTTGKPCGSWAVVGTTTCRVHGAVSDQSIHAANIRLTISELAERDPRPLRAVLADAVRLADVVMRDLENAVIRGPVDAVTVSRLLESTRYASALAQAARREGLPLDGPPPSGGELLTVDQAFAHVVPAVMACITDIVASETPRSYEDSQWQQAIMRWVGPAVAARAGGREPEPMPPRPEVVTPEVTFPGRAETPPADDVVDAEVISEDDVAPDADVPADDAAPADARVESDPLTHHDAKVVRR